jgi:hypothetical protein
MKARGQLCAPASGILRDGLNFVAKRKMSLPLSEIEQSLGKGLQPYNVKASSFAVYILYITVNSSSGRCVVCVAYSFFFTMALPAHLGPRPLIQFSNHFSETAGLLGRVISPSQGRYLNTG